MNRDPQEGRTIAPVLLAAVLPLLAGAAAGWLFGSAPHSGEPLYRSLQLTGGAIALAVALLLCLRVPQGGLPEPLLYAAGAFTAMGLVDFAQAAAPFGDARPWLWAWSSLLGGSLFALVWRPLPAGVLRRKRLWLVLIAGTAIAGSAAIGWRPGLLPSSWEPGGYSFAVRTAGSLGGLGWLAAAGFFLRRYGSRRSPEDLAFAVQTWLFGTSAIGTAFAPGWSAAWWVWQGFRMLAYSLVLAAAYDGIARLSRQVAVRVRELERYVQLRTVELGRLAAIVEFSDDAIFSKSLAGIITTWNKGAERLYGYTAAQAIGQPLTLVVPPELQVEVHDLLERIARGEFIEHYETVRQCKDGRRVNVSVTLSPVKDEEGKIVGASAVARDITGQRRAEEQRRRTEQELEQFFKVSADLLCIAGFDGYFKRLNAAWVPTLGWPRERLLAEPWMNFVHPDDLSATRGELQRLCGGRSSFSFENRYRTSDGCYRWLRWSAQTDLESELIFAAARDVTAEKAVEEDLRRASEELEKRVRERTAELESANRALHDSEELFRRLFEDSPIGTVLVGPDQRIRTVNRSFIDLLGYSARELSGRTLDDITHIDDLSPGPDSVQELASDGRASRRNVRLYAREDGRVVQVVLTGTVIRDEFGRELTALAMAEDITQRVLQELEITRLNREMRARVTELTAINQELESFNYTVSHDLRAPLRHLDGYSNILLEEHGAAMPEDARNCARRIGEASRRMGRMVDELLELSRTSRREADKRLTGLRSLVEDVLAEMQPDLQGREIEWRIGELPFLECDPTLTRQIFANLLANACKFSQMRKPAVIEVGQTAPAGTPVVFVRDNGVGFNMKHADKLFGVFERLHRSEDFEGTGVGLATVQRIVHRHGGKIWAEAKVDRGATFYFTLAPPVNPPPVDQPAWEAPLPSEAYAQTAS